MNVKLTCQLPVKKNYMMIDKQNECYGKCNDVENDLIDSIYMLFVYHGIGLGWLLTELLDPVSRGIGVELVDVSIIGNNVILQPSTLMSDNPQDYAAEINRDELIRLVREWKELIKEKVSPIYIYYKDGKYGVADILPEGVEL